MLKYFHVLPSVAIGLSGAAIGGLFSIIPAGISWVQTGKSENFNVIVKNYTKYTLYHSTGIAHLMTKYMGTNTINLIASHSYAIFKISVYTVENAVNVYLNYFEKVVFKESDCPANCG